MSHQVIGRRGHMEDGEYVDDQITVRVASEEHGLVAHGKAPTEEEAVQAATEALEAGIQEKIDNEDPDKVEQRAAMLMARELLRAEKLRAARK